MYTREEVLKETLEYFNGDSLAADVWIKKYALRDRDGNLLEKTPKDMHKRIADEIVRIENKYPNPLTYDEVMGVLDGFKYIIPQGSPMFGIGNNHQIVSLSNCFVIGSENNEDSYGSIMKIDEQQVQISKRRGGVGHDLSHIRPNGSTVKNSALTSTGIVPFMERYSNSIREVGQKNRRGALMLTISVLHPEAENFIDAKLELGKVTGANISVKLTDEFMRCVIDGKPFKQQFPIHSDNPSVVKYIDAKKLWDKIIHNAWKSAEPGILFWDTVIRESIPDCYKDFGFETTSCNPCAELPLSIGDSCRLTAINLYSYVENPFTDSAKFNFDLFKKHVNIAQRIMDDIVDLEIEKIDSIISKVESDPESDITKATELSLWQKIREMAIKGRRTGLGITAEGDMLAALGMRYASEESIEFSSYIHKTIALEAYRSSMNMSKERGSFPVENYMLEVDNPFINRIKDADPELYNDMRRYGRRNIALLTIAPTGSLSILSQTTSGIEPAFMISYKRRRKINPFEDGVKVSFVDEVGDSWEEYHVFHPKFETWLSVNGFDVNEVKSYDDNRLRDIIKQSPYHLATSNDIDWLSKVRMQGEVQKWVDHSISVTVNVPKETTEQLVSDIYKTAWEVGCKGMTIYRDGSRSGVLISNDETPKFTENNAPKRPKYLDADVVRFQNNYEKWVAIVGKLDGRPYEIFTGRAEQLLPIMVESGKILRTKNKGQRGKYDFIYKDKDGREVVVEYLSKTFNEEYWNYAKLISGILRHGMPIHYVIELIQNLNLSDDNINTWKNGVVRALKTYVKDGTKIKKGCPECGAEDSLVYQDGCLTCKSCGYSKCG